MTEPTLNLPAGRMFAVAALVPALCGAAWFGAVALGPWPVEAGHAGLVGAAIVAAVSLLGVVVMGPWKARPASLWMTLWLGGTVARMLATPLLTYLLYSAAPLPAKPLALAVGSTYLVTLMSEAILLARHLGSQLPKA